MASEAVTVGGVADAIAGHLKAAGCNVAVFGVDGQPRVEVHFLLDSPSNSRRVRGFARVYSPSHVHVLGRPLGVPGQPHMCMTNSLQEALSALDCVLSGDRAGFAAAQAEGARAAVAYLAENPPWPGDLVACWRECGKDLVAAERLLASRSALAAQEAREKAEAAPACWGPAAAGKAGFAGDLRSSGAGDA